MSAKQVSVEISALQPVVAELQKKIALLESHPRDNWLPAILGRFKDDPEFDEAMKLAGTFRNSGGFPDDASNELSFVPTASGQDAKTGNTTTGGA